MKIPNVDLPNCQLNKEQTVLAKATEHSLQDRIFTIRGEKVILDSDLADIYGGGNQDPQQSCGEKSQAVPSGFCISPYAARTYKLEVPK